MKNLFYLLLIFFVSCSNDDPGDVVFSSEMGNVNGARYSASNVDFSNTYGSFIEALNEEDSLDVFLEVNHAANAISLGRVLAPTRVVFFGSEGTMLPLLQENQLAGLNLPPKMMFYQNQNSEVFAVYNSIPYLSSRYNLNEGILQNSAAVLRQLANAATRAEVRTAASTFLEEGQGIINKESNLPFQATYNALINAINNQDSVEVLLDIDFQEYAPLQDSIRTLRPTRALIVSMPQLTSALMQESQTLALDLPQKILVWEDELGIIRVSYEDPAYLSQRHGLDYNDQEFQELSSLLERVTDAALGD